MFQIESVSKSILVCPKARSSEILAPQIDWRDRTMVVRVVN